MFTATRSLTPSSLKLCKPPTERGVLFIVSSLFDSLGFLATLLLSVKILLQEFWRDKIHWDKEIPEPYMYLSQWQRSQGPHVLSPQQQLCSFADASGRGYAAVSYLQLLDEQGVINCSFITGYTRNAHIREWAFPRVELQAAVLAVRLNNMILQELDLRVKEPFCSLTQ